MNRDVRWLACISTAVLVVALAGVAAGSAAAPAPIVTVVRHGGLCAAGSECRWVSLPRLQDSASVLHVRPARRRGGAPDEPSAGHAQAASLKLERPGRRGEWSVPGSNR